MARNQNTHSSNNKSTSEHQSENSTSSFKHEKNSHRSHNQKGGDNKSDSAQYKHLKQLKQKLQSYLISRYLKKPSFTTQYSILYKSYMILIAFILTILCNYAYLCYERSLLSTISQSTINMSTSTVSNSKGFSFDSSNLISKSSFNNKNNGLNHSQMWINTQTVTDNGIRIEQYYSPEQIINYSMEILPLKGKFSVVFFQLMILTTVQIIYETILQCHYRFTIKKSKSTSTNCKKPEENAETQQDKQIKTSKKLIQQKIQKKNYNKSPNFSQSDEDQVVKDNGLGFKQKGQQKNEKSNHTSQQTNKYSKFSPLKANLQQGTSPLNSNKVSSNILNSNRKSSSSNIKNSSSTKSQPISIHKKCQQLQQMLNNIPADELKQYSPIKFLYIFSLLIMQPYIWQGIVVKSWSISKIHLIFILSCIGQFFIWNLINFTLISNKLESLSDHQKLIFNGNEFIGYK